MPRKTELKLLSERPVPERGESDDRRVIEAFPAPPPAPVDNTLAEDVLEILRKSHERIASEVQQVRATAGVAVERADAATNRIATIEAVVQASAEKTAEVEKNVATAGQAMLSQVSQLMTQDRSQARQMAAAGLAAGLGALGERLARALIFAIERLPALLALAAAIWLWNRILPDPQPLQLVALGLFGAVVIAPAIWLGQCKGKS